MFKKILVIGLVFLGSVISFLAFNPEKSVAAANDRTSAGFTQPEVVIRAGSDKTIEFLTQNGITRYGVEPETAQIPHLTLYHNQTLSQPAQRSLVLEVRGLQVPPTSGTISLLVETQHGEPVPGMANWERIPVWQETRRIGREKFFFFKHTFSEISQNNTGRISTPTGYYRYTITVKGAGNLANTKLYTFEQDYAFLLENEWVAQLPDVPEESPGAAPDELVIYYCDMIPFQKDIHDTATWIKREAVKDYVGKELLPEMVAAFHLQSTEWGFPWYQAWSSTRKGEDAERLSVALTDGKTWYHGQAYPKGNSRISINVSGGENYSYDTLTDGLLSTFHHELFHNLQKNLSQYFGGDSWASSRQDQWKFIAEGTAVLASSVAQPEIQFAADAKERAYITNANLYLGTETIRSDIGRDFSEISPYHAALYWRFLYEQCGGMNAGVENPTVGMQIIRQVLVSLYQTVERDGNDDLVVEELLPKIMDRALAGSTCPFRTYAQSLAAFAQAVDTLRYEGGRCQSPGLPVGCDFYDPYGLYNDPPVNAVSLVAVSP